jgi:predicted nucleic-acid-binding protein
MKNIADTNVLVRAVIGDDPEQTRVARRTLSSAEQVILGRHALCETVWVLSRRYKLSSDEISRAIVGLLNAENVVTDSGAIEVGLRAMDAGADFADGVIAYEVGGWVGRRLFLSIRRQLRHRRSRGIRLGSWDS